jgi:hypothetical protein
MIRYEGDHLQQQLDSTTASSGTSPTLSIHEDLDHSDLDLDHEQDNDMHQDDTLAELPAEKIQVAFYYTSYGISLHMLTIPTLL